jgi:hypothetical protein
MKSKYFKIVDLPEGDWSVSWPGFEAAVVNSPTKLENLLSILFEQVKVREAVLGIVYHNEKFDTMYIQDNVYYSKSNLTIEHLFGNINGGVVSGCRVPTLEQAEQLVDIFEKRLVWRRLSSGTNSYS